MEEGRRWRKRKRAGAAVARADGRQKTSASDTYQCPPQTLFYFLFTAATSSCDSVKAQRPFIHLQDSGVAIR